MSQNSSCMTLIGCLFFLTIGILIASIIVGSVGAASYVKEKHDESVFKLTMCFVKNFTRYLTTCSSQSCVSNGFSQSCTTNYYTCYREYYTVIYNISNGREIESVINETGGPGADSVNQTYTCYYDSTNEKSVRWTWPNSLKYLIMLSVGWSVVGFYILLIIALIFWCIYLRSRQYFIDRRHKRNASSMEPTTV